MLCLFITSCGEANYEPQEYISTNLNDERIELSKEIFNKLKKEHYLKNFVNEDFNKEYIEALISGFKKYNLFSSSLLIKASIYSLLKSSLTKFFK